MTFCTRIYAFLTVSVCCFSALPLRAQDQPPIQNQLPAIPDAGAPTGQNQPAAGQLPPSPVEEEENLIKQVDPLDREAEKKKREKAARDARKNADDNNAPLPGSIAESEQAAARRAGPEVEEDSNTPVQEYTGPAVLSRSYSINQALVPEQVRFNESLGLSSVYDTGVSRTVNADGSFGPVTALEGALASWGFSGRHYFHHDVLSVNYTGNYSRYSGYGAYNGSNQSLSVSYMHVLTRRLMLNLSGAGSSMSLNSVLEGQQAGPQGIANISLSSSPNIQIFDIGEKQMTLHADLTWQPTARLSFSIGTAYFGVAQDSSLLLGVTGQQARADVTYRFTRRMTIGSYYSFNNYLYSKGYGNSDTNSFGAIYSYAFTRTMQLRFRGGLSEVQSLGLVTVPIPPAIAALLGTGNGLIDSYATFRTTDMSAQFIKDFRGGRTASLAYARGISPGNGVYQTSQQESISASVTAKLLRRYSLNLAVGRDTLKAATLSVVENLGEYQSQYVRLSVGRTYQRGIGANLAVEFRNFDLNAAGYARDQLRITSGFTWGAGRLWPF